MLAHKPLRMVTVGAAGALALLATGCAPEAPTMLEPRGPRAAQIADLWWFMFWVGTAVWVIVVAIMIAALVRRRRPAPPDEEPGPAGGTRFVVIAGAAIPAVILLVTFFYTVRTLSTLAAPPSATVAPIEVIGHLWWWEVRYPDRNIVTANEVHIPVGQPVEVRVTSADVIHSFWVPRLMGKIDMIPGQWNSIWLEASEPGVFLGACAEFCGVQHAQMRFVVVAEPPDEYARWLDRQQQAPAAPTDPTLQRGIQLFTSTGCAQCHIIRGVGGERPVGPDLTHIGSRRTLAAGWLENNRGNMAAWIVTPQKIKPGNYMPPTDLTSDDLLTLVSYLESLE